MSRHSFSLALLLSFLCVASFGATFVVPTDAELAQKSPAIVTGTVRGPSYTERLNDGSLRTISDVLISGVVKGNLVAGTLVHVASPGGVYGNRALIIPGTATFHDGENVLLFLTNDNAGELTTVDFILGKFLRGRSTRGEDIYFRDQIDGLAWDENGAPHVEQPRLADKFLPFLRGVAVGLDRSALDTKDYRAEGSPQRPLSASSDSFSLTPETDAFTATGYTQPLSFSSATHGERWPDFPNNKGFRSYGTQTGAPNGGIDSIVAGTAMWTNDCASNVNYTYVGTTATAQCLNSPSGGDGINGVSFNDPCGEISGSFTGSGILAIGGFWVSSTTNTLNSETFWNITEGNVVVQDGLQNWSQVGNATYMNALMAHELGHTLGFRHSDQNPDGSSPCNTGVYDCSNTAIMYSTESTAYTGLQAWDQRAVRAVYPGGSCTTPSTKTKSDFNGDHIADILWRETSSGQTVLWQMAASGNIPSIGNSSYVHPGGNQGFSIVGTGDFNNDGQADILWRDNTSGATYIWIMHGSTIFTSTQIQAGGNQGWNISGVADFDGDGYADILWRQVSNGQTVLWKMTANGSSIPSIASSVNLHPGGNTGFSIVGVGDFDGDGTADILWRDNSSGATLVWKLNPNFTIASSTYINNGGNQGWNVAGIGDFDANGTADVLWRETSSGATVLWQMSLGSIGIANSAFVHGGGNTNYTLVGVADFNADNKADILFRENSSGQTIIWIMNGSSITTSTVIHPGGNTGWNIFSPVK